MSDMATSDQVKDARIDIRVPVSLVDRLAVTARMEKRKPADMMRVILEEGLAKYGKKHGLRPLRE
jgi:hypothetical protein